MSFFTQNIIRFPELFDCLNDNTAIEANANNIGVNFFITVNFKLIF